MAGVADKGQNVSPFYPPYLPHTTTTSLKEVKDTSSSHKIGNDEGSPSLPPLYPPIWPYSTSASLDEVAEDTTPSMLLPSLQLPSLLSSDSSMNEEKKEVIEGSMKQNGSEKSQMVGNDQDYVKKDSKERKADEAYLKKKADVYRNLQRYKRG